MEARKAAKLRLGWIVIGLLAALTAVEFWVAVAINTPLLYLTAIALVKAGLIVQYFMHVSQLWHKEGHE